MARTKRMQNGGKSRQRRSPEEEAESERRFYRRNQLAWLFSELRLDRLSLFPEKQVRWTHHKQLDTDVRAHCERTGEMYSLRMCRETYSGGVYVLSPAWLEIRLNHGWIRQFIVYGASVTATRHIVVHVRYRVFFVYFYKTFTPQELLENGVQVEGWWM